MSIDHSRAFGRGDVEASTVARMSDRAIVEACVDLVLEHCAATEQSRRERPLAYENFNVAVGNAGHALFVHWASAWLGEPALLADCTRILNAAISLSCALPFAPGLWEGHLGVACAVEMIAGNDGVERAEDLVVIDEALEKWLTARRRTLPCDFVGGLAGTVAYAIGRIASRPAERALLLAIEEISSRDILGGDASSWGTSLRGTRPPVDRAGASAVPCGLAHGVAGIVAVFASLARVPAYRSIALETLVSATKWLGEQRIDQDDGWIIPAEVREHARTPPWEPSWCWGNPGVALALAKAAAALGDNNLRNDAVSLILRALAAPEIHRLEDVSLCHGRAGGAHILAACYRLTGDLRCDALARVWHRAACESASALIGRLRSLPQGTPESPSLDLMNGLPGAVMALMSGAMTPMATLNRLLLCD